MNVTININAPELAKAVQALADAISSNNGAIMVEGKSEVQPQQPAQQQPAPQPQAQQQYQQPPVQQAPQQQQAVPTTQPAQEYQAPPAQTNQPQQAEQQAVPTSAPSYSMDQLAVAATSLVDAGKREALVQLIQSFGVQALTALPKEQYGAFATKLREMGAKI